MTKLENEHEVISIDGSFIRLKTQLCINKQSSSIQSNGQSNEKSKDNIEIKVKVVSTQLTQNGRNFFNFLNLN
jgi:hypothetical protein